LIFDLLVEAVIAPAMNGAKIRIVPQLPIGFIKCQFATKNFVRECLYRLFVVNMCDLPVVA